VPAASHPGMKGQNCTIAPVLDIVASLRIDQ
jgi:hypothetical protein